MKQKDVLEFIEAADRLVNLLSGPTPFGQLARRKHDQDIHTAYNRYDLARAALVGDPAEEK
jgi:hypothetical protein